MKICKSLLLVTIFYTNFIATNVFATDLMDVYRKTFANDPKFKAARASWLANKEILAINQADLLPTLGVQGSLTRSQNESENSLGTSEPYYINGSGYLLQLTQPLFNFGSLAKVWGAQASVRKAQAAFMAAEEQLLQRTAEAYFNVLQAQDVWSYAKAHKAATERLFIQTKRKYEVGLIAIADLEDARKNYDKAISEEIGVANELEDKLEQLNEITGTKYHDLSPVKKDFPLLPPKPANIERWVKAAEQQNFELIAARYDTIAARENIKIQNAGHLPTVTAQGKYNYQYDNGANGFNRTKGAAVGVVLDLPIFQGGKVAAAARQANYQYQEKVAIQEQMHRAVVSKTRQAYLGIISNISKIKADLQAIKSAASSLRVTQAKYTVGARTITDVLMAQAQLYEAQKTFAHDEYTYIMQLLSLKALAGILDVNDLKEVNSWLERPPSPLTKHIPAKAKATLSHEAPPLKTSPMPLISKSPASSTVATIDTSTNMAPETSRAGTPSPNSATAKVVVIDAGTIEPSAPNNPIVAPPTPIPPRSEQAP